MHIRELATLGVIILVLTPGAFADGAAQAVDGLEADVDTLESQLSALQTENAALEAALTSLTGIVDALVEQQRCHTRPGDLQADENGNYAGGVDWRGCDKTGLQMWGPAFGGAVTEVLTNADLRHVDFTLASILGVYMGGADLEGAVFKNANLGGSDLTGANIIGPDGVLFGRAPTVFINTSCPDGTNSDAVGGTRANNRTP